MDYIHAYTHRHTHTDTHTCCGICVNRHGWCFFIMCDAFAGLHRVLSCWPSAVCTLNTHCGLRLFKRDDCNGSSSWWQRGKKKSFPPSFKDETAQKLWIVIRHQLTARGKTLNDAVEHWLKKTPQQVVKCGLWENVLMTVLLRWSHGSVQPLSINLMPLKITKNNKALLFDQEWLSGRWWGGESSWWIPKYGFICHTANPHVAIKILVLL